MENKNTIFKEHFGDIYIYLPESKGSNDHIAQLSIDAEEDGICLTFNGEWDAQTQHKIWTEVCTFIKHKLECEANRHIMDPEIQRCSSTTKKEIQ